MSCVSGPTYCLFIVCPRCHRKTKLKSWNKNTLSTDTKLYIQNISQNYSPCPIIWYDFCIETLLRPMFCTCQGLSSIRQLFVNPDPTIKYWKKVHVNNNKPGSTTDHWICSLKVIDLTSALTLIRMGVRLLFSLNAHWNNNTWAISQSSGKIHKRLLSQRWGSLGNGVTLAIK